LGDQTIRASLPSTPGSTTKAESPLFEERGDLRGCCFGIRGQLVEVVSIAAIAAEELPRQSSGIEIGKIIIGGRIPPIALFRHTLASLWLRREAKANTIVFGGT
jgi:hypothetical protein